MADPTNLSQDDDFAAMLADFEGGARNDKKKRPQVGDLISGPVISIGKESIFVDVGGKAEGVMDRNQVSDSEGKLLLKLGDRVEARVVSDAGGVFQLRVKLARGPEAKAELLQAQELGLPVEGLVTEVIKGGVTVDVVGVRGFCPASQIDARFVEDLAVYVGQRLTFRITKYESGSRGNLVLSRRALVEEENARRAIVTRELIKPGAVLRGKIVGIKPFGAFVDLGGIEGMLHISEFGFSRVEKPEDVISIGQELDVAIKSVEPGDKGERISLTLKSLANDPWRDTANTFAAGSRVKGTITRLQQFGAFVEIAPGVEGLVHISELGAGKRIAHPKEAVEIGQQVEVTVISVDTESRRISLTMAASDGGSAEDVASAAKAGPSAKFGTFADLLSKRK
jgi:small subunit ribosomal protein S1